MRGCDYCEPIKQKKIKEDEVVNHETSFKEKHWLALLEFIY